MTGSNCLAVGINAIKAGTGYGTGTQAPQVEAALAVKVAGGDPLRQDAFAEGAVRARGSHHEGERRQALEGLHLLAATGTGASGR